MNENTNPARPRPAFAALRIFEAVDAACRRSGDWDQWLPLYLACLARYDATGELPRAPFSYALAA